MRSLATFDGWARAVADRAIAAVERSTHANDERAHARACSEAEDVILLIESSRPRWDDTDFVERILDDLREVATPPSGLRPDALKG